MWTYNKESNLIADEQRHANHPNKYVRFSKIKLSTPDKNGNDIKYIEKNIRGVQGVSFFKGELINIIKTYDKSSDVNKTYIDGNETWFDKNTRVGLINSLKVQQEAGRNKTTIWYKTNKGTKSVELAISKAIEYFYNLELYASECYNVTQVHIQNINKLETVNDIINYNITTEYPIAIKLTTEDKVEKLTLK